MFSSRQPYSEVPLHSECTGSQLHFPDIELVLVLSIRNSSCIADAVLALQECKACREVKPLGEYYRSMTNRDGLVSKCKRCMAQTNQRKVFLGSAQGLQQYAGQHVSDLVHVFLYTVQVGTRPNQL